jgi:23S rRNA (cytidine1920-2'-O)/16S rRNA (cytidine1409-2'-O)-methyltransferase
MNLIEYICEEYGLGEFEANGCIMAGKVLVNDEVCSWVKYKVKKNDRIRMKYKKTDFVTRAGRKLEKALNVFGLDVTGKAALDIGASEGGFTDCLLKHGARKVYAVDVAYGILDYGLRSNAKVVALERKNARYLTEEDIPETVDVITSDVSFISLLMVIPPNLRFLNSEGVAVLLFKPQFELAPEDLGKNGIPLEQEKVVDRIRELVLDMRAEGLFIHEIAKSPIKGNSGNVEYLLWGSKNASKLLGRQQVADCVYGRGFQ